MESVDWYLLVDVSVDVAASRFCAVPGGGLILRE